MWLTFRSDGQDHVVDVRGDEFVIGRDADCDLSLADRKVSRRHAALRQLEDGRVELRDLGSRNGTYVDEGLITDPVVLGGGEEVRVGRTRLSSSSEEPDMTTAAPPPERSRSVVQRGRSAIARRGQSAIARLQLRRDIRRLTVVSAVAAVLAAVAVALFVTGVFSGGGGPSTDEIVRSVAPSTVLILGDFDGTWRHAGTGWVLDARKGLIVTNAHVVNSATRFQIGVDDDRRRARVVGVAPCEDLAVLAVDDTSRLKTMRLTSQSRVKLGETVVAVGFPATASDKDSLTAVTGVVSRVRTTFDYKAFDVPTYRNAVQTDAAINPGNSGGPLVDVKSRLVGVTSSSGLPGTQNQNYAIGVDRVKEITSTLRRGQSIAWTGIGFDFQPVGSLAAKRLPPGIATDHAISGTPADRAGFNSGTFIVTEVNGQPIDGSVDSYCNAIGDAKSGDAVSFTIVTGRRPPQRVRVRVA